MAEDRKTAKGNSPFGNNTVFEDAVLGTIELKHVSYGDSTQIAKYLNEKSPRRFTCLVIHHQLVQPQLKLNQVEAWEDEFLERICTKFLEDQKYYGESFKRRFGRSFFTDFQDAFATRDEEHRQLSKRSGRNRVTILGRVSRAAGLV